MWMQLAFVRRATGSARLHGGGGVVRLQHCPPQEPTFNQHLTLVVLYYIIPY